MHKPLKLDNEITSRGPRSVTIPNHAITERGRISDCHMLWAHLENPDVWRQTIWGRGQGDSDREFRYSCDAGLAPKPFRDDGALVSYETGYILYDKHSPEACAVETG